MFNYWKDFYKKNKSMEASSFSHYVLPYVTRGEDVNLVDIGCGNGRDLFFFQSNGVSAIGVDPAFPHEDVVNLKMHRYMDMMPSPKFVYARFFWHTITREEQREILDWVTDYIFIEARTTEDRKRAKHFPKHRRIYVDVSKLVTDLKLRNFQIIKLEEGTGLSPYDGEDPFLCRVIARKLHL